MSDKVTALAIGVDFPTSVELHDSRTKKVKSLIVQTENSILVANNEFKTSCNVYWTFDEWKFMEPLLLKKGFVISQMEKSGSNTHRVEIIWE